jgi:hypothetical protein
LYGLGGSGYTQLSGVCCAPGAATPSTLRLAVVNWDHDDIILIGTVVRLSFCDETHWNRNTQEGMSKPELAGFQVNPGKASAFRCLPGTLLLRRRELSGSQ